MLTETTILFAFAVLFGVYVAWNIGANDVANAVGTAVGSGALKLKHAVLIAAIFEFLGASLLGGNVSETLESGIVNPELFSDNMYDYIYGMLASLLAAGVWLQIASFFGWPVSTTHSIVGAVLGFGLVAKGFYAIEWSEVGSIALSWVISPLLGAAIAYSIFSVIRYKILHKTHPIEAAKRLTPYIVFFVFAILTVIIFVGGLHSVSFHLPFLQLMGLACCVGVVTAIIAKLLLSRVREAGVLLKHNIRREEGLKSAKRHLMQVEAGATGLFQDKVHEVLQEVEELAKEAKTPEASPRSEYDTVERIFAWLQIIIACFMALAHGSNDVANAIGPLAAIVNLLQGRPLHVETIPPWLLLLGGIGIVIGLATWGWRVIETIGKKLTELTPSRGFAAGFGAATTTVLASKLGLPISTTHVLVGAVLGVGFARGIGAIDLNTLRDIAISWVVTVPAGAILSIIFFLCLRALF